MEFLYIVRLSIYLTSERCKLLALKYKITKETCVLDSLIRIISHMKQKEKTILKLLLSDIKEQC